MKKIFFLITFLFLLIFFNKIHAQWVQTNGPTSYGNVRAIGICNSYVLAGVNYNGVYITSNNGQNWFPTSLTSQYPNTFLKDGNSLFAGTPNGIYVSTNNGFNWTITTFTYGTHSLLKYGNMLYAGTDSGLYYSTNSGQNWIQTSLNNQIIQSIGINNSAMFAGANWNGIFVSTNSGQNWTRYLGNENVYSLAVNNPSAIAGTYLSGALRSTNNGQNWNSTSVISSVYALTRDSILIFAGTGREGIYLSTNNGLNWTQINEGLIADSIYSLCLSSNYIFAGMADIGKVYRRSILPPAAPILISPPNGATGISLNPTLKWSDTSSAVNYRLQVSMDSLFTTMIININVPYAPVDSFTISGLLNNNRYYWRVFALDLFYSNSPPVWHFTTGPVFMKQLSNHIPGENFLFQNYPDPFNPVTTIRFQIKKHVLVELNVYDLLGRKISTLVDKNLEPGLYETQWNSSDYPSGVYFYKINAGEYSKTKKMVLIK